MKYRERLAAYVARRKKIEIKQDFILLVTSLGAIFKVTYNGPTGCGASGAYALGPDERRRT
jgi:hypothetical protein